MDTSNFSKPSSSSSSSCPAHYYSQRSHSLPLLTHEEQPTCRYRERNKSKRTKLASLDSTRTLRYAFMADICCQMLGFMPEVVFVMACEIDVLLIYGNLPVHIGKQSRMRFFKRQNFASLMER
ncbi:uncharacterized protein G2W53_016935 [Senna tora]|uniref:Uncharacterized protein n=1 Tax=Senna tora TaxID=362788 RepID=A0A834WNG4_9FABA|nr:uncharacterized protein G2W53_016935 [Senna tora]